MINFTAPLYPEEAHERARACVEKDELPVEARAIPPGGGADVKVLDDPALALTEMVG